MVRFLPISPSPDVYKRQRTDAARLLIREVLTDGAAVYILFRIHNGVCKLQRLLLREGCLLYTSVLMQSGKSAGLSGAIAGGAETFLSKGKAKTLDAKLAKATKWFGLVLVVLTLVLTVLMHKGA